jgi:hypothetical protein
VIHASLPLLASLLAGTVNLDGTVVAQGRAGSSPILAGQPPQAFAAGLLTPQLELGLRDERGEARLAYLPRLAWQVPNALDYEARPLILHQASLRVAARATPTTDVTASAAGSYGQPDYAILPQLLGPGQAALPQVQTIVTASGNVALQRFLTRRVRLLLAADGSHFRVLGDEPQAPPPATPAPPGTPATGGPLRQTLVDAVPGALFAVTRVDDLLVTSAVSYGSYSSDVAITTVTPLVSWRAHRPAGDELRLSAGLSYAHDLGARSVLDGRSAWLPAGGAEITSNLLVEDDHGVRAHARLAVEQHVDPILGTSGPRLIFTSDVLVTFAPDWAVAAQGDFSTSLRGTPLAGNPDETAFAVRVPIRYRVSKNAILEFGGLWADRAPAFAASDFRFHQRQLWGYASITLTTRDVSGWSIR